jgi:hypothetical protein
MPFKCYLLLLLSKTPVLKQSNSGSYDPEILRYCWQVLPITERITHGQTSQGKSSPEGPASQCFCHATFLVATGKECRTARTVCMVLQNGRVTWAPRSLAKLRPLSKPQSSICEHPQPCSEVIESAGYLHHSLVPKSVPIWGRCPFNPTGIPPRETRNDQIPDFLTYAAWLIPP